METYTVDGRTFRVGELCLVKTWSMGWQTGVIVQQGRDAWVYAETAVAGVYPYQPERVLLLSENFSPGM